MFNYNLIGLANLPAYNKPCMIHVANRIWFSKNFSFFVFPVAYFSSWPRMPGNRAGRHPQIAWHIFSEPVCRVHCMVNICQLAMPLSLIASPREGGWLGLGLVYSESAACDGSSFNKRFSSSPSNNSWTKINSIGLLNMIAYGTLYWLRSV